MSKERDEATEQMTLIGRCQCDCDAEVVEYIRLHVKPLDRSWDLVVLVDSTGRIAAVVHEDLFSSATNAYRTLAEGETLDDCELVIRTRPVVVRR